MVGSNSASVLRNPRYLLEVFAWSNLAFLAVDICLAHAVNDFALWQEWLPIVFSGLAALLLMPGLVPRWFESRFSDITGRLIGWLSIVLGVAGLIFHLHDSFFVERTMVSLVYSAPFAAPLAYSGLGFLLLLNRTNFGSGAGRRRIWARWVVFFGFGGFVGNLAIALGDHAQNGFFERTEWIPVVSSAFAVSFLGLSVINPNHDQLRRSSLIVMLIQILVGGLGAILHVSADLQSFSAGVVNGLVYGAPVFAPLLFADVAVLAGLGLWFMDPAARD